MIAPGRLSAVFLAARGAGDSTDIPLETAIEAYVAAARAARPGLAFDTDEFVRYLAARAPGGAASGVGAGDAVAGGDALPSIAHAGDLLLAYGCVLGLPAAVSAFHRGYQSVINRVLARGRASADLSDDVTQTVYERLLVGGAAGEPARIADYRGTGPLRSWVATVVATTLLMMRRAVRQRRERAGGEDTIAALEAASPELLHMKERYATEVEQAILSALAELGDCQRMLLRLHLGERMTIDQLGVLYGVNRTTTARWLAAAREALVKRTRDALKTKLGLTDSQCDSVAALARSQLDVSLIRHLTPRGGNTGD